MSTVDEMTSRKTRGAGGGPSQREYRIELTSEEIPVRVDAHTLRRLARSYFFSAK
jgi:hypothetical protein